MTSFGTEQSTLLCGKQKIINNIVNILLTLLSATETETEIKSPVGSWTLSQDCADCEREGNVLNFSSNRLPNNEPWNIQHGNGKTTHTRNETQLTTGKRETAKQLRNMADNSPNPNPNPKPKPNPYWSCAHAPRGKMTKRKPQKWQKIQWKMHNENSKRAC